MPNSTSSIHEFGNGHNEYYGHVPLLKIWLMAIWSQIVTLCTQAWNYLQNDHTNWTLNAC